MREVERMGLTRKEGACVRRAMRIRLWVLAPSVCLAALLGSGGLRAGDARPPNIVLILADDLGYGDLGCYGSTTIKTPSIDRLATEGVRFTSFYMTASVCTPARASLLTGRYHVRTGIPWPYWIMGPGAAGGLAASEVTIAEALGAVGYATACIGKWHLGALPGFLPTRRGFDRYFGIPYSNDMVPTVLMRGETVIEDPVDQTTLTSRYTTEALEFIRDAGDEPFFLYLPHTFPHVPLHVSDAFKGRSAGGLYGDVVEEIDWSVGEILAELDRLGLENETLVIFTSDNGPWLEQGADGGHAGTLRGGKFTVYEGGVRVPFLARWPGRLPPGHVVAAPAVSMDLFPTFVGLGGGEIPRDRAIDGKDILPLLAGQGGRGGQDFYFFWKEGEIHAVRSGAWKLHFDRSGNPTELYDLEADPAEGWDIAGLRAEVVGRLAAKMRGFAVWGFEDTALNGVTLVNYLASAPEGAALARAAVGAHYRTDRDDALVSVPAAYHGGVMVRTADKDRHHTGEEVLVLSLIEDVNVIVAYDARATTLPGWLQDWTPTGEVGQGQRAGVGGDVVDFRAYVRRFSAWDTVTLGGNRQGGGDGEEGYVVLIDATRNRPPVAQDGRFKVAAGTALDITLEASDPDGDELVYAIVSPPSRGRLSGDTDGDAFVRYVPDPGFAGEDSFSFRAHDGAADSDVAVALITVEEGLGGDPVGHWPFAEGEGSMTLDVATNTTGVLVNGPSWSDSVPPVHLGDDHALEFDGVDDLVDTTVDDPLDLTGSMTIALWVHRRGDSTTQHLVSKNDHPGNCPWQLAIVASTNALRYYANGTDFDMIDSADSVPSGWHHVALVRDATARRLTFYMDGAIDSGGWRDYDPDHVAGNTRTAKIGARGDGGSNWFDGWLDDVRLYDRALGGAEVGRLASGEDPPAEFIRGDGDGNGRLGMGDVILGLLHIFTTPGPGVPCVKAIDFDDNGGIGLSDVIGLLLRLFAAAGDPPAPFPGCGPDPTIDNLPCAESTESCRR